MVLSGPTRNTSLHGRDVERARAVAATMSAPVDPNAKMTPGLIERGVKNVRRPSGRLRQSSIQWHRNLSCGLQASDDWLVPFGVVVRLSSLLFAAVPRVWYEPNYPRLYPLSSLTGPLSFLRLSRHLP
jgi:hypothetical protein